MKIHFEAVCKPQMDSHCIKLQSTREAFLLHIKKFQLYSSMNKNTIPMLRVHIYIHISFIYSHIHIYL